jgi:hypothetical protein
MAYVTWVYFIFNEGSTLGNGVRRKEECSLIVSECSSKCEMDGVKLWEKLIFRSSIEPCEIITSCVESVLKKGGRRREVDDGKEEMKHPDKELFLGNYGAEAAPQDKK